MLHDIPPPGRDRRDESLTQRRGYVAIRDEEEDTVEEEDNRESEDREAVRKDGWLALAWSFSASAVMTVRSRVLHLPLSAHITSFLRTFFPSSFPYHCLAETSHRTGFGRSHQVFLMLVKA